MGGKTNEGTKEGRKGRMKERRIVDEMGKRTEALTEGRKDGE